MVLQRRAPRELARRQAPAWVVTFARARRQR
jgi:hypothetical protein